MKLYEAKEQRYEEVNLEGSKLDNKIKNLINTCPSVVIDGKLYDLSTCDKEEIFRLIKNSVYFYFETKIKSCFNSK